MMNKKTVSKVNLFFGGLVSRMEENKDFKAEEITKENQSAVEENELVTEDTEATSKEEAEEIVEEYTCKNIVYG